MNIPQLQEETLNPVVLTLRKGQRELWNWPWESREKRGEGNVPILGSWGTEGWVNYSEMERSLNAYVLGETFFCWCMKAAILMSISCGHSNAFQTSPQGSHFKLFVRGSHEIGKVMLSSGKLKRRLKPPQGQTIQGWEKGFYLFWRTTSVSMGANSTGISPPGRMCHQDHAEGRAMESWGKLSAMVLSGDAELNTIAIASFSFDCPIPSVT